MARPELDLKSAVSGVALFLLTFTVTDALQIRPLQALRPATSNFRPPPVAQSHLNLRGGNCCCIWSGLKADEGFIEIEARDIEDVLDEVLVDEQEMEHLKESVPHGFFQKLYGPLTESVFKRADVDKDGKITFEEAYILVLRMYIKVNRQAPLEPPPRELVRILFETADRDKSGYLDQAELVKMATKLFARASIRIAAHKFCTFVLAPTLAHVITDKVIPKGVFGKALTSALKNLTYKIFSKIVPRPLHGAVLNVRFANAVLTIIFMSSLGNIFLSTIDTALGYKYRQQKAKKKKDAKEVARIFKEHPDLFDKYVHPDLKHKLAKT